jgi:hypothetical protein
MEAGRGDVMPISVAEYWRRARDRAQLLVVAYETGLARPGLFADGTPHRP